MNSIKKPVLAIIGPTAVGKTAFSLELARKINAEIISVDSRQVYRYLDVGTDKVLRDTRKEILHHLIDIVDPDQIYSAADFAEDARDAVERIYARGRVPLLVGGTPFYFKALGGALSEDLPSNIEVRRALEKEMEQRGLSELHKELCAMDPNLSGKIHENDSVRTVRALEIYRITGKTASWWYENQRKISAPYNIFYIGLVRGRKNLYRNIEYRVKKQFSGGYPEEVEWLLAQGYSTELPALQGFGYRELASYLQGKCTFEEAVQGDIRSTKAFSRRQMTWFKHFEPAVWYDFDITSVREALYDVLPKCLMYLQRGALDENCNC